MKKLTLLIVASVGVVGLLGLYNMTNPSVANAATTANSKLSQIINPGTLTTVITGIPGLTPVNPPTFAMSAVTVKGTAQLSTGTFGNNTDRIYVLNTGAADNGWTLTLNATTPGTGVWSAAGGRQYKYNGTAAQGRLTVDPSAGTVTPEAGSSTTLTGITKGSSASFSGSTPITLMSASAGADKIWEGYITGIGLKQDIPAGQLSGTYILPMTQTVTAI